MAVRPFGAALAVALLSSPGAPAAPLVSTSPGAPTAPLALSSPEAPAAPLVLTSGTAAGAASFGRQWQHLSGKADGAACRAALHKAGVRFRALPDQGAPDQQGCGVPHGVVVTRGPTGVSYGALLIDCSLALELVRAERALQAEAKATFGKPLARVETLGSYHCRPKRGGPSSPDAPLSEHAFGNAVDLAAFVGPGWRASVARDYRPELSEPTTREGKFLRRVQARLRRDTSLTRVLGPDFNAEHRDHFHLDAGPRWWPFSLPRLALEGPPRPRANAAPWPPRPQVNAAQCDMPEARAKASRARAKSPPSTTSAILPTE
jgi:hypothetical protein